MKLHTIDGLIQVGYAKQRPTVIVGAVCDYLNLHFLSIPYLSSSFSPLLLPETVGNSSIPSWKQFMRLRCRGTFGTGAFPILTTDRQVPAVLAVGAVHFFLPVYWSLFIGRKYREMLVKHMLQAIVFSAFPHLLH